MQGAGGVRLHVAHHVQHDRDGAQRAHDAADPQRVGDGLLEAEFLRNLEVGYGRRPVAADLDRVDHVARAFEGTFAVDTGGDLWCGADGCGDAACNHFGQFQPLFIDVVQRDFAVGEFGIGKNVAQQIAGKHGTAGADQGDFQWVIGHGYSPAKSVIGTVRR